MRFTVLLALGILLLVHQSGCVALAIIQAQNAKIAAAAGMDSDTDAIGAGVELNMTLANPNSLQPMETLRGQARLNPAAGVTIAPGIFYGRGSQDFGDVDPMTGEPLSYSVLQLGVHAQYPIPLSSNGMLAAYPLAGPAYYRFSYSDCPFADACTENIFLVNVGGGVQYGNFGLEAFTGLGGPNLRFRAKYMVAL